MSDPFRIMIWAQMFFDDGSVTQGMRIDAAMLERDEFIDEVAAQLLRSVNRNTGFLLAWGAGNVVFLKYPRPSASLSQESDSSASLPEIA